jgi:hypothetical protein
VIRILALSIGLVALPAAHAAAPAVPADRLAEPAAPEAKMPAPPEVDHPVPEPPAGDPPVVVAPHRGKRSGFWGSDRDAPEGRPYQWEHMAIGGAVALMMLILVLFLIRKYGRKAS